MRARGVTLVELMATIAIVATTTGIGLRMTTKNVRGEKAPEIARALLAAAREAQHAAVAMQHSTRLRLTTAGVITEERNPTAAGWRTLAGRIGLPPGIELCNVDAFANLQSAAPACPIRAGTSICFDAGGRVTVSADGSCATTLPTGATVYFHTVDGAKRYKLPIFSLTGMARLVDSW